MYPKEDKGIISESDWRRTKQVSAKETGTELFCCCWDYDELKEVALKVASFVALDGGP